MLITRTNVEAIKMKASVHKPLMRTSKALKNPLKSIHGTEARGFVVSLGNFKELTSTRTM